MTGPLVSICIPAYQAERHLRHTLRRVLNQTADSFEVVVLDNATTDGTAEILRDHADPRMRVVRNSEVLPLVDNWNRLLSLAEGTLVKVVCADDLIRPDAVERQQRILMSRPDVSLVASRRHLVDDDGVIVALDRGLAGLFGPQDSQKVVRNVVRNGGNPLGETAGAMFRRADFERVGGFDGRLLFPMDLDLWIKLLKLGSFFGHSESLAAFRVSRTSLSARVSRVQYQEQGLLIQQVIRDPHWQIRRWDTTVSAVGAPLAGLRRALLFGATRLGATL
ncbi:Glycosyltransferase involved in cell wall bisynthesis [Nakamurella panacisegetis]|uniref:Glycosyltransferase involved in cell wall bisynthesis n=1 Tax=Nakamurella panacisegetis TaxID=1090615 RepID=A0A1H0LZB6_9ACTN|nr:glycosyltransferase [Nakamurella panacisegetis]SDO73582.1 Glycosyltransferase involved in cell wall bisynthesis [Nakamurella panacisegetis]